jgi:hypothetical protein
MTRFGRPVRIEATRYDSQESYWSSKIGTQGRGTSGEAPVEPSPGDPGRFSDDSRRRTLRLRRRRRPCQKTKTAGPEP